MMTQIPQNVLSIILKSIDVIQCLSDLKTGSFLLYLWLILQGKNAGILKSKNLIPLVSRRPQANLSLNVQIGINIISSKKMLLTVKVERKDFALIM